MRGGGGVLEYIFFLFSIFFLRQRVGLNSVRGSKTHSWLGLNPGRSVSNQSGLSELFTLYCVVSCRHSRAFELRTPRRVKLFTLPTYSLFFLFYSFCFSLADGEKKKFYCSVLIPRLQREDSVFLGAMGAYYFFVFT